MTRRLDRMAIEEVGANPSKLARAIHQQMGDGTGPVPIVEIAAALDIVEIRTETLTNFEGALLTDAQRDRGTILVNRRDTPRERFTIAHELGHFLSPHHVPTGSDGFWCGKADFRVQPGKGLDRHRTQEAEANTFAIDLLAPPHRTRSHCRGRPCLEQVLNLSEDLLISREAASRRYVEHHSDVLAVLFSQRGKLVYHQSSRDFPRLGLRRDDLMPDLPSPSAFSRVSSIEEAAADDWVRSPGRAQVTVQTHHQANGWATTLLHAVNLDDEEDDDGVEDAFERFDRFSR